MTLRTLFAHVDQAPRRCLVHDDAVFPDRALAVEQVLIDAVPRAIPVIYQRADPPVKHGPALKWLLDQVQTEYVLYSQDDHRVKRPLPVQMALRLLDHYGLHQIRFNKRDTMDVKGAFRKVERWYPCPDCPPDVLPNGAVLGDHPSLPLCIADHWYFQTGVWRVAAIQPVIDWWYFQGPGAFDEHCEVKVNQTLNGQWRQHVTFSPPVPQLPEGQPWNDSQVRADVHRTFIWGRVGEPAFIEHIGTRPEDWALERANRDPIQNI